MKKASVTRAEDDGRRGRSGSFRRRVAGLAAILLLATVGHGLAASQADWASCRSSDLDVNVPACGRIIDDPATSAADRIEARLQRALAYLSQNSMISAGRDLAVVLEADPGNVKALTGRAITEFKRGNVDQAVLDYSLARRLESSTVDSMRSTYEALKEVATAAEQKPAPQARLDDLQRPLIKCRTGTRLDNLSCVPIICPTGQKLDGNSCVQIVCSTGYRLQGSMCMMITCPTGQRLVGNDCQQIVCGSDETLTGNDCVPNKRYGALSLSRTSRLAYGMSWDRLTEAQAQGDSMDRCRSNTAGTNCRVIMTTDGCISLYWTRTGNGWGAVSRRTAEEADRDAYAQCRSVNRACVKAGSFCNRTAR
jgi:hypothetical protein